MARKIGTLKQKTSLELATIDMAKHFGNNVRLIKIKYVGFL